MIIESIILAIFICSLGGIFLILARNMPALINLPQNGDMGFKKHRVILDAEKKIKKVFVSFEKQIFLHKFLSWVKRLTIKAEVKIDHLLHGIRKKAQQIDKNLNEKK